MLPLCIALCAIAFGSDLATRAENQGPTPEAFILRKLGEYQATTERLKAAYLKKCGALPVDTEVKRDTGGQKPDRAQVKLKVIPYEVKIARVIPGSGNDPLDKDDPIKDDGGDAGTTVPGTFPKTLLYVAMGGGVQRVAYDPIGNRATNTGDANAALAFARGVGEPLNTVEVQLANWNGWTWNRAGVVYWPGFGTTCVIIVSRGGRNYTITYRPWDDSVVITGVTVN